MAPGFKTQVDRALWGSPHSDSDFKRHLSRKKKRRKDECICVLCMCVCWTGKS